MKKKIYILAGICLLVDQISKFLAHLFLNNVVIIPNFFSLTYVENTGAAWGILDNNRIILVCVSVITLLVISKYLKTEDNISKLSMTSYGILIGGIFGNLLDRMFRGYVIDFLNFNIFGYNFPVFNIADILIVIGVLLMALEVVGVSVHGINCKKK